MHTGWNQDSNKFQDSSIHSLIVTVEFPQWAVNMADDAYQNKLNIVAPYYVHNLPMDKDAFNFYHYSCIMTVEQVFGMLVSQFGIYWRHLRTRLKKYTKIIAVTCKLQNFNLKPFI